MRASFLWDDDNVEVIRRRGLTVADIEHIVEHGETDADVSNMSGWPVLFGIAQDGRTVAVAFRWEDSSTICVLDSGAES